VLIKSLKAGMRLLMLRAKPGSRRDRKKKVLYLSYNGLLEPILPSQGIPYMKQMHERGGYDFVLLTWEKAIDVKNRGKAGIKALKEDLRICGIEWHCLRYHKRPRHFATLYDLIAGFFKCLYLIPLKGVGIVHTRGITPGVIPLFLSKLFRIKILYDMRGLLAEEYVGGGMWSEGGLPFRLVKFAEARMLRSADAVTVLTNKHYMLNKGLSTLKSADVPMEVIPCCVDTGSFGYGVNSEDQRAGGIKEKLGLNGRFVLLYPGKIGSFYYMDEMLDFFKCSLDEVPNATFLILTRDSTSGLIKAIEKKGISASSVKVMSSTYDEMPALMRIADAGIFFINPYKKIGSSPIKMGEFLASGVPVIINPGVGDTEGLVRENKVGVVVEEFKPDDYREALRELIAIKGEGEALKRRCRQTAREHLSLNKGVEKYLDIYMRISG
ncbi:glycosyltransferase, partial [Candidatus Omnitrophota bacterium]